MLLDNIGRLSINRLVGEMEEFISLLSLINICTFLNSLSCYVHGTIGMRSVLMH
jgi:hypothetical protein